MHYVKSDHVCCERLKLQGGGGLSKLKNSLCKCVLQQLEQACIKILGNTHCPDTSDRILLKFL